MEVLIGSDRNDRQRPRRGRRDFAEASWWFVSATPHRV